MEDIVSNLVYRSKKKFDDMLKRGVELSGYSVGWCMSNPKLVEICEWQEKNGVKVTDIRIEGRKRFSIVQTYDFDDHMIRYELVMV